MIKCNRCGKVTPAGAFCQACGAPLSTNAENGTAPGMEAQDQPALPAWLESLRAGERSSAPMSDPPNFSTADFMDDGSLPNWMRAERSSGRDNTASNPSLSGTPFAPSSFDANASAENGLDLQSLIDEQALPPWIQDMKSGQPAPVEPGGLAASSLVQPEDTPDWMRVLQQPSMNVSAPPPASAGSPAPFEAKEDVPQGFSANDLLDQQALPSWMKSLGTGSQNVSSADMQVKSSGTWGMPQGQGTAGSNKAGQSGQGELQAGFSARDLLDQQALPSWMKEQGASGQSSSSADMQVKSSGTWGMPQSQGGTGANKLGQSGQGELQAGFSARDLLDQQALPSWMKEQGTARQSPSSADMQMKSSGTWGMSQSQGGTGANKLGQSGQGELQAGFSARDLLDQQALPSWMKEQGASGQGPSNADMQMRSSGVWGASQAVPGSPVNKTRQLEESGSAADAKGGPAGVGGQGGFSASSLLDVDSLPQWLRSGGLSENRVTGAYPATKVPSRPGQPGQPAASSNAAGPTSDPTRGVGQSSQSSGVAASSFIDLNALPEWMRTANEQPQGGPSSPLGAPPSIPHRAENARVPNRPRREMTQNEGSEEAASVFASMLGVASGASPAATPSGFQARGAGSQVNSGMPGGMSQPGISSQGNMGMPGGMSQPGMGSQGNMGMPGGMNQPGSYGQASPMQYGALGQYDIPGQSGGMMGQPPQSAMPNMPPLDNPYPLPGSLNAGYGMQGGAGSQSMSGLYGSGGPGYGGSGNSGMYGGGSGNSGMYGGGSGNSGMYGGGSGNSGMYGGGNGNMSYGVPPSPIGQQSPNSSLSMNNGGSAMRAMPDPAGDQKNKKRGLFGAFLDWLSR